MRSLCIRGEGEKASTINAEKKFNAENRFTILYKFYKYNRTSKKSYCRKVVLDLKVISFQLKKTSSDFFPCPYYLSRDVCIVAVSRIS